MDNEISFFPAVPQDLSSIVKPEELVDVVEMTPLTLQDRRIYNLLIGNAWNKILNTSAHVIERKELTSYVNSNNQDIASSLRRLMSAIVQVKIRHNRNGEASIRQIALLGTNEIERDGEIKYSFPAELVKIIENTQVFARLHTKVMFELSSKYSLALYEFLQKRGNLQYKNSEKLTVDEVRGLLGVSKNSLKSFGHFNDRALKPACMEVSMLSDFDINAEPIRTGRKVTHVEFTWGRKADIGAKVSAVEEIDRGKMGRKARMTRSVDRLDTTPQLAFPKHISESAFEKAKQIAINAGTGWDIYAIREQFFDFVEQKGAPENYDGAFIGFVRKKVADQP